MSPTKDRWSWVERAGRILDGWPAYAFVGSLLVVYTAVGLAWLERPGNTDYWEHLAAIAALARSPFHADDPFVGNGTPTHLFTPYHLLWAFVVRASGVTPVGLTPVMGVVNVGLFVWALRRFAASVLGDAGAALAVLVAMLCLWNAPWPWSGFYDLGLLPLCAMYPFWFALGLALWIIAEWLEPTRMSPPWRVALGIAFAVLFVIHPLTAGLAFVMIASRVLLDETTWRAKAFAMLPLVAGLVAALAWPLYPVLGAIRATPRFRTTGFSGTASIFYTHWFTRIAPALAGTVYVVWKFVRRERDVVAVAAAVFATVYAANAFVGRSALLARTIVGLAWTLQLATVLLVRRAPKPSRVPLAIAFGVLVVWTGRAEMRRSEQWVDWAAMRGSTADRRRLATDYAQRVSEYRRVIRPSDVALAPTYLSWTLPAIVGCRVVPVLHPTPFSRDFEARLADGERFFGTADSAARRAILAHDAVDDVIVPDRRRAIVAGLESALEVKMDDGDRTVYRVHRESLRPPE